MVHSNRQTLTYFEDLERKSNIGSNNYQVNEAAGRHVFQKSTSQKGSYDADYFCHARTVCVGELTDIKKHVILTSPTHTKLYYFLCFRN